MHEFALAEAVVKAIYEEITNSEVEEVVVSIGELQNIDIDSFKSYVELLIKGFPRPIKVLYEEEEVEFKCRFCGYSWKIKDLNLSEDEREAIHFLPEAVYSFTSCPRCKSKDFEIVKGRGITIRLKEGVRT